LVLDTSIEPRILASWKAQRRDAQSPESPRLFHSAYWCAGYWSCYSLGILKI